MNITPDKLEELRRRGFAKVPQFLGPEAAAEVLTAAWRMVPSFEAFHNDREAYAHLVSHPFAGLYPYPFGSDELDSLAIDSRLVSAAETYLGTPDIRQHSIYLWAKYSDGVDYEQVLHRDFFEKTAVTPDLRRRENLTAFILLNDVALEDGPTHFVDNSAAATHDWFSVAHHGLLQGSEEPLVGSMGDLYLFDFTTLHRGTRITRSGSGRLVLIVEYVLGNAPWLARRSWIDLRITEVGRRCVENMPVRCRSLFGIPAPGHAYWTRQDKDDIIPEVWSAVEAEELSHGESRVSASDTMVISVDAIEHSEWAPCLAGDFPFASDKVNWAVWNRSAIDAVHAAIGKSAILCGARLIDDPSPIPTILSYVDRHFLLPIHSDGPPAALVCLAPLGRQMLRIPITVSMNEPDRGARGGGALAVAPGQAAVTSIAHLSQTSVHGEGPILVSLYADSATPGLQPKTFWMDTHWQRWKSVVYGISPRDLGILGFPDPHGRFWTTTNREMVARRYPALDLSQYLDEDEALPATAIG